MIHDDNDNDNNGTDADADTDTRYKQQVEVLASMYIRVHDTSEALSIVCKNGNDDSQKLEVGILPPLPTSFDFAFTFAFTLVLLYLQLALQEVLLHTLILPTVTIGS